MLVAIPEPEARAFQLNWQLVEVECFQVLAVCLVDVYASDLVEEAKLELDHHVVLDRDEVGSVDLESRLGDVAKMRQSRLDSFDALLLCVFLCLGERSGAVEDLERLEALFEDLAVVGCEAHGVAHEVEHLDIFERLQHGAGLSEVAQLVEGSIKAEEIGEVARDGAQSRRLKHVVCNAKVDQ